jgi:hypothetical protein
VASRADGCCGGGYRFSPACSATSVRAVDLFNLPPPNFLEIGRQIEICRRETHGILHAAEDMELIGVAADRQHKLR